LTTFAGVLGFPVAHSRSPAMMNAAFRELGLDWTYMKLPVPAELFAETAAALPASGYAGANVTIPHKQAALELADESGVEARAIGAANTLSFAAGRIAAENTDATGFLDSLPAPPAGRRALVLGAGGSARAVVWALVTHGADVSIWNRTRERAERLASELGAAVATLDPASGERPAASFDLLVNATTVGMGTPRGSAAGLKSLPFRADSLDETHQLVDLAYGPVETELARAARAHGAKVVDGLEVLVRQGAASLRIWTGLDPPIEAMRRAARATWKSSSVPDI
jgi:shikimate dehydrogenase